MMFLTAAFLAIAASSVEAVSLRSGSVASSGVATYAEFRSRFGVHREGDSLSYAERAVLFKKRAEAVNRHNQKTNRLWTATVSNKFGDFTDLEFQALLGHRPIRREASPALPQFATASLLQGAIVDRADGSTLAASLDWREKVASNATLEAKDQGACGSCWAVAAAGALEMHAAATNAQVKPISYEQLVDCVENLKQCGGTGGCSGATAELALEFVQNHGLDLASNYHGYQSGGDLQCRKPTSPALLSTGYVRLPENQGQPLLEAVATHGPVVVSADASGWSWYDSGVFDSCGKDSIINHAILLMGYGEDEGLQKKYWLIRNSWGPDWGEQGFIRLLRHASDEEYCGTDTKPEDGIGCAGGPSEMTVCGMCGILTDSAYPTGVHMADTSM